MVSCEYTNLVNYDSLIKVKGRNCSPAHYKHERINSKCHPKHTEREILPGGQWNRGNIFPEYMHRNIFPSILVHMTEDTDNTLCQKDPSNKVYCSKLNHTLTKLSFMFLMRPTGFFLKPHAPFKFAENTILVSKVPSVKEDILVLAISGHHSKRLTQKLFGKLSVTKACCLLKSYIIIVFSRFAITFSKESGAYKSRNVPVT